ncbi:MAG: hypothetical protein M1831_004645 [Alyxoria varia]|nr:MAG: hypothetical protein M1831_004645 [Alyxoria varia]
MPAAQSSPPKRMTRARARAVEEKKPTKITTPAAKVASTASKRTARNTKTDENEEEDQAQESASGKATRAKAKDEPTKMTKPQARVSTKPTTNSAANAATSKGPVGESTGPAPRTRAGRPRKNTTTKDQAPSVAQSDTTSAPKTRTRAKAETEDLETTQPDIKATRVKKKVTFQDEVEGDKENVEIEPVAPKKGAARVKAAKSDDKPATRARGGRKPATRNGPSKRGKPSDEEDVAAKRPRPEPLSPKKETQVAKGNGNSNSQPDPPRLLGSPAKRPHTSPVKPNPKPSDNDNTSTSDQTTDQHTNSLSSVDELQLPDPQPGSPSKTFGTSITGSPLRGGNSPFKDSMKVSPRKPMMGSQSIEKNEGQRQPQDSLSSGSPRKINIDQPQRTKSAFDMQPPAQTGSALNQSPPKRPSSPVKLGSQFQMTSQTPMSSAKVSLLQSPAKRPPSSVKQSIFASSTKPPMAASHDQHFSASGVKKSPEKISLPTPKNLTTSLKAAKSPKHDPKPYIMTPGQGETVLKDELLNAPSPFSPEKSLVPKKEDDGAEFMQVSESPAQATEGMELDLAPAPQVNEKQEDRDPDQAESATPVHALYKTDTQQSMKRASSASDLNDPFIVRSPAMYVQSEDGSEDELSLSVLRNDATPSVQARDPFLSAETPLRVLGPSNPGTTQSKVTMTTLADRFGAWTGTSPDKKVIQQRVAEGSVFSPLHLRKADGSAEDVDVDATTMDEDSRIDHGSKDIEEALTIREDQDIEMEDAEDQGADVDILRQSQISEASEEFGDENATPADSPLPHVNTTKTRPSTCTPARVFPSQRNIVHTTSKVPLKPAAQDDDSPLERPKGKRSRSLSGALTPRADLELQALRQIYAPSTVGASSEGVANPEGEMENGPSTPNAQNEQNAWSVAGTPSRTPRPDLNPKLLSGAVVFVDVHTGEGADASAIFVDLLNQMGAKCMKQWSWNPRNSVAQEGGDSPSGGDSRVGITHVVFKDGGKRTMEKVREANGLVSCVGVGWVLDCESRNKWVDESEYAIDPSTIPRGGHRRRKSMEPKSSLNGSTSRRVSSALATDLFVSPSKEFLNLDSSSSTGTPAAPAEKKSNASFESNTNKGRRVTLGAPAASAAPVDESKENDRDDKGKRRVTFAMAPSGDVAASSTTPLAAGSMAPAQKEEGIAHESALSLSIHTATTADETVPGTPPALNPATAAADPDSPGTPYFLHDPHSLVQRTCPPKQQQKRSYFSGGSTASNEGSEGANKRQLLFPLSGRIEDQEDEEIRKRLVVARRKSEMWKPRVGSPLGRLGG